MHKSGEPINAREAAKPDPADVKAQLLRRGEFYRAGIVRARADIKHGAKPENIMHNVVDHATFALRSRLDGMLRPTGIDIGTVMPYAMSVLGFINRRRMAKPALGISALLAVAGWYLQRHRGRLAHW